MLSAVIAFAFGVFEAVMLQKTLSSFLKADYQKAVIFLSVKLLTYGAAAILLVFVFEKYIIPAAIGFTVGLPLTVIIWFVLNTLKAKPHTGDGQNENINNN